MPSLMPAPETLIIPGNRLLPDLRELWKFRELAWFFCWRDLKVKYRQTLVGVVWVLAQPLALMVLSVLAFSSSFSDKTGNLPYPVFAYAGLWLWYFLFNTISLAAEGMVANAGIIRKVYFPRLVIPLAAVLTAGTDLLVGIVPGVVMLFWYRVPVNAALFWCLPLALFLTLLTALGAGLFLSALNVRYRDVRYALPFLLQLLLLASPVLYPGDALGGGLPATGMRLNPFWTALSLLRQGLGGAAATAEGICSAGLIGLFLLLGGLYYFHRTERQFADLA